MATPLKGTAPPRLATPLKGAVSPRLTTPLKGPSPRCCTLTPSSPQYHTHAIPTTSNPPQLYKGKLTNQYLTPNPPPMLLKYTINIFGVSTVPHQPFLRTDHNTQPRFCPPSSAPFPLSGSPTQNQRPPPIPTEGWVMGCCSSGYNTTNGPFIHPAGSGCVFHPPGPAGPCSAALRGRSSQPLQASGLSPPTRPARPAPPPAQPRTSPISASGRVRGHFGDILAPF